VKPPTWTASFIAGPQAHIEAGHAAPYMRTEFDVAVGLASARLFVTGLGIVEAHINGAVVGDEVLCPGWTSYDHRIMVSDHDVTGHLRAGRNAIGAIVGEGWAIGRVGFQSLRNRWADQPSVFLQLELTYADRVETVATDGSWRTTTGAVLVDGIYDGESFDARHEPAGWDQPAFDDRAWAPCVVIDRDRSTLQVRSAPPIRRTEPLDAVEISVLASGEHLVDFGQVFSGWVQIRVDGSAGTTVTIRHAELLVNGEPEYETNRTALVTDRYTLRGGGPEVWEPRFTFHGFRYAVIDGWPGELLAEHITGVVIHSDLERTGWFECSDERLNQLHRNIVWSWRGNSVGLPTDCPQRDERLGWTGDINAFSSTAVFLFDVREFLRSWLEDLAAEQREQGNVPVVVPDVINSFKTPTALWGDVAVSLPWTLFQHYGDLAILERCYPSMCAFIDGVEPLLTRRGLWNRGFQFGDWLDPDSPPANPAKAKAESALVATAFLCRTTRELAGTADLLGFADDAARYRALNYRVRAAFRHEWVTPSGRMANESQTSYALAICFGLLEPHEERRAGKQLAHLAQHADYRISTGFAGTPWILHALSRTGHDDVAYRMLEQTEPPSFLYPLTMGATTVWERWDSVLPDGQLNSTGMTSLNHYALGAVGDWMHKRIGGIRPTSPGYRTVELAPRPGRSITSAKTVLQTPNGRLAVEWSDVNGLRHVAVAVPPGVDAHVVLPDHPDNLIVEVGAGSHSWEYSLPAPGSFDLTTQFEVLQTSNAVWDALTNVVGRLMDGVPNLLDHLAAGGTDLATALPRLPGVTPEFIDELRAALALAD
jgi:alpha-L-rhamnosidase